MCDILYNNESWTGPVTLFYCDMLALIQRLMGDLMYKDNMSYTSEQHFTRKGTHRYEEIYWSTFWWETQVSHNFTANSLTLRTKILLRELIFLKLSPLGQIESRHYYHSCPSWNR